MNNVTDKLYENTEKEETVKMKKFTLVKEEGALIPNLAALTVALLFSRYHLIFGAHPLGIAMVATMPSMVWASLIGAAIGALTLGKDGIIYGICALLTVGIRMLSSKGAQYRSPFGEGLLLRMCAATISGFVAAVYEVIVGGFTMAVALNGLTMILVSPVLVFVFSGLFSEYVSIEDVISDRYQLTLSGKEDKEKYDLIFFQCSALVALFLIALTLKEINLFGIGADLIFISFVTLLSAKKYGAVKAAVIGFVTALGTSGVTAVAFALVGLVSGLVFPYGVGIALISTGAAVALWTVYSSGTAGLFSTIPEYAMAATVASPLLKGISKVREPKKETSKESATDMAGVFALSYKSRFSGNLDTIEEALNSISSTLRSFTDEKFQSEEELCDMIISVADEVCLECGDADFCGQENVAPAKKNIEKLSKKLMAGERILPEDINTDMEFCSTPERVASEINMRAARLAEESFLRGRLNTGADQYDLVGKLISEARLSDRREKAQDPHTAEKITEELIKMGYPGVAVKVFGERHRRFIVAMEDEDGSDITRVEILRKIEQLCKVKTAPPEFFRKEKLALMECGTSPLYSAEFAISASSGGGEISGDSAIVFESGDNKFFAICSDGMGSGDEAKETSELSCKFLRSALGIGSPETALHLLNNTLRGRGKECSATVDIFSLDLMDGSATFIKSGAAPSFIKRDSSIFRIKSATAPIGLMKSIDSERIQVEVRGGDYVIMLSDGVSEVAEESPWLLELLTKPPKDTARAYADYILNEAKRSSKSHDDMIVIVMKIIKLY